MTSLALLFAAPEAAASSMRQEEVAAPLSPAPNILFAIADDWGWPHAGAYGDPVVQTPTFDRVAGQGVLFEHAFVSSPSCTPSRAALVTGQYHWRLEESANLWSTLQAEYPVYPELLQEAGYHVGHTRKGWGPGRLPPGGRSVNPAGPAFKSFDEFLEKRPADAPFCFWFGSYDPHRGYKKGSGEQSGIDVEKIRLPACFPDAPEVRGDVADYYFEVQRFDREVGEILDTLEERRELANTLIVVTGDHGMPFPRHKTNLYDSGSRVPLAVAWGAEVPSGRRVTDFVSLTDLAPTFLAAAGVAVPEEMTGRSLLSLLKSKASGRVEVGRDHALFGRERHVPAQRAPSLGGYPARAIRTDDWLLIRNYSPDLWPSGVETGGGHRIRHFADCDDGPTKTFIMEHKDDPKVARAWKLAFGQRPGVELYDLGEDPEQLNNLADQPELADVRKGLLDRLEAGLRASGDPRVIGGAERFDEYPYYGSMAR